MSLEFTYTVGTYMYIQSGQSEIGGIIYVDRTLRHYIKKEIETVTIMRDTECVTSINELEIVLE